MKPILETPRLKLIPFTLSDIDLLHQTLTDPFVRKYLMDDEVINYGKAQEFILTNEKYFEEKDWGLWKILIKEGDAYAGFAGLWIFFDEDQPQLLYGLLPGNLKHGYATEASEAVVEYAFTSLNFSYLLAACDAPNTDSKKVCERLNMVKFEEREINGNKTAFYRLENKQPTRINYTV